MSFITRARITSLAIFGFVALALIYYVGARVESVQELVQRQIADERVIVFSKSYCPYCARAKKALKERKVEFKAHELDQDERGGEIQEYLLKLTQQRTVPNIFINGKSVGGSDALLKLIEQDQLEALLEQKSASHQEL